MFGVMWVFEAAANNAFAVASNSSHLSEAKSSSSETCSSTLILMMNLTPLSQTRPHSSSSCLFRRACASLQISGREQGECRRSRQVRVPQPLPSNSCNCTSCFSSIFISLIPCLRIDGWTPLFCACTRPYDIELVKFLVESKADVAARTK